MLDVTSENVRHELEEMVKGTSVALEFDCQVAALDVTSEMRVASLKNW